MRIIGGEWRGRRLTAPEGEETRPTADRTRETLFNMLASRLGSFEGLAVGDFFAGSGALGLESLSRGAARCVFVEQAAPALRALRANIAALRAHQRCEVRAVSATRLGPATGPLDLVLVDAPYRSGAGVVAIDRLARLGWIAPAATIVLELAADEPLNAPKFTIEVERRVGKARLAFMSLKDAGP